MGKPQRTALKLEWERVEGLPHAFALKGDKGTSYWKGAKGWWASRAGTEGIQGPFKGSALARTWAEEPHVEKAKAKAMAAQEKERARQAKRETTQAAIWGTLPAADRRLAVGQVWRMRHPRFPNHQILIVDLRKTSVLALTRSDDTPWKACPRDVRSIHAILRLYTFLKTEARVPKLKTT